MNEIDIKEVGRCVEAELREISGFAAHIDPTIVENGGELFVVYAEYDHCALNPLEDMDGYGRLFSEKPHNHLPRMISASGDLVDVGDDAEQWASIAQNDVTLFVWPFRMPSRYSNDGNYQSIDFGSIGDADAIWIAEASAQDAIEHYRQRFATGDVEAIRGGGYAAILDLGCWPHQRTEIGRFKTDIEAYDALRQYIKSEFPGLSPSTSRLRSVHQKAVRAVAEESVAMYNLWASGDTYVANCAPVVRECGEWRIGDIIDSCGGYYGSESAEYGMRDMAAMVRSKAEIQQQPFLLAA